MLKGSFWEYRLPTWGITLLGAVGIVSAAIGFIVFLFSFYTPGLPSDVPRRSPPLSELVIVGYLLAINFVTLALAVGLLIRWNTARKITMILAPAPFVGSALQFVHQYLVNQLISTQQANAIMQLAPLSRLATALTYTGVSFPGIAPLLAFAGAWFPEITILVALLNLGIPFYLTNNHIKNAFKKTRQQQAQTPQQAS